MPSSKNHQPRAAKWPPAKPITGNPPGSRTAKKRTAKLFPVKPPDEKMSVVRGARAGKDSRRKVLVILGIIAGGVLLALIVMVGFLDGYGQKERAQKSDAIVVLGARVRPDGKAGQGLTMRVMHAVRLYKKGFAPKIIMTGGVGNNPPSEAKAAAELAVKSGVPREDVIEESKSTSTWENALYASSICKTRRWKSVLIVSDPFHLWRAQRNFRKCGVRSSVSPAAAAQWKLQPARRLFWTAREAVLVARDWCLRRV